MGRNTRPHPGPEEAEEKVRSAFSLLEGFEAEQIEAAREGEEVRLRLRVAHVVEDSSDAGITTRTVVTVTVPVDLARLSAMPVEEVAARLEGEVLEDAFADSAGTALFARFLAAELWSPARTKETWTR